MKSTNILEDLYPRLFLSRTNYCFYRTSFGNLKTIHRKDVVAVVFIVDSMGLTHRYTVVSGVGRRKQWGIPGKGGLGVVDFRSHLEVF